MCKVKTNQIAFTTFLLICISMSVLCTMYYKRLQSTVTVESHGYLQEIIKQVASNTSRNINDNFSVLGMIESVLKNSEVETYEELQDIVTEQQDYWNYKDLLLLDLSGNAYDAHGRTIMLSGDASIRDVIVNNQPAISPSQSINGSECMMFTIPVTPFKISGNEICAIATTYELSTFDQFLSMSSFSGQGYAHIIQKDGTTIVRSSSENASKVGYNIIHSLSDAKFSNGDSLNNLQKRLSEGESGVVAYTLNGSHMYMAYYPLEKTDWYVLGNIPVSTVNAKSNMLMSLTLLLCACIILAFSVLITYVLVSNARHKRKLELIAYVDSVTGGNTIQRFYEETQAYLDYPNREQYAIVYSNIEKFKILNDEFGVRAGDELLVCIHNAIKSNLEEKECLGRLAADNFCILIKYSDQTTLCKRLKLWHEKAIQSQCEQEHLWLAPVLVFGVYVISNTSLSPSQMVDRAKLALCESTTELDGRLHYGMYNDGIHQRLVREKHLEDMMEESLKKHEFEVYLQPKYIPQSETIGGAEALVRWNSVQEGMIFPDEFIGLFEKNGFIVPLDLWVFEQVCRSIRIWIDEGKTPVRVSINCSRVHLKNPHFLYNYIDICKKYNTPTKYIEIELTENIVFEDVEHLSQIINDIHNAGFGCSMDDFGSGYSSLNLIQDIPVDTIKIDKVFFRKGTEALDRTQSVVGSIIGMSRSLHMKTVAEGVEKIEQVEMLKDLGCDLIQGYYFARPMPLSQFELLLFGTELTDVNTNEKEAE